MREQYLQNKIFLNFSRVEQISYSPKQNPSDDYYLLFIYYLLLFTISAASELSKIIRLIIV